MYVSANRVINRWELKVLSNMALPRPYFLGPFTFKWGVNKDAKWKTYVLIFNCLTSRVVYIVMRTNYCKEELIMTLRNFLSLI